MNNTNEVFFVSFQYIYSAHLADFFPIVEKNIYSISVVSIFEYNKVLSKFCPEIAGIHTAPHNEL